VELKNGEATVYFNPVLQDWDGFDTSLTLAFGLTDLKVNMKPDYSQHYKASTEGLNNEYL
jgi:hypothetical protein